MVQMTNGGPREARVSRESRLLLLTIVVCAVVLLLLARLRFPEPPPAVDTSAPPLERLAARASYEALAADIESVETMIADNLVVLRVAPQLESTPRDIGGVLVRPEQTQDVYHVAAFRISAGMALASIEPGARIVGIVGRNQVGGSASVIATDPVRRIARVRVPEAPMRQVAQLPLSSLRTPVYVVAVEGTQAGVTVRPVFLGRGDRFSTARWPRPLLALGGTAVAPGALLFSFAGEFIGAVVLENGAPALAGARDVLDTFERLAQSAAAAPSHLGISVQPLTPPLAAALRAPRGVVVSDIDPDGPAAGVLEPTDVITAIDGWSSDDADEFLLHVASLPVGRPVTLAVMRQGTSQNVQVPLVAAAPAASPAPESIAFVRERGAGARVVGGTAFPASGLRPGDIVTRAGDTANPAPAQVLQLLNARPDSGFVVLTIRRDGRQRVVAVPVAAPDNAAAR
jgi:hypothetical protein